ncbi:preprotein translocase subunit SecE [Synechococcus sp. Tobar12-5m-g]|uniref:preprotein translocase subunit SecE n=1 Tax=unclassified Synechococcus TaxID=2626047 RepID=UPI0037DA7611|nr:preprotein translocase subunit SecE [Synechococcus sp. Tobar12-5m-g]MCP9874843.1 preprotein translocase subunit SecE [Synechococcus sp. Cruz CV-v-12]
MDSPSRSSSPEDTLTAEELPQAPKVGPAGFLPSLLEELGKVVWPSRQQLFSESVAVILMVTLSAAAIAAVDRFYSWGSSQVFR